MGKRPLLLDLFCGAGGCSMGYHRAGFDVVGIDNRPQPRYPFRFIQGDALKPPVDLRQFDAIHASPPCQAFSTMKSMKNARKHSDLLTDARIILSGSGKPWVIENVIGAPLTRAIILCGTMFGLSNGGSELRRHRVFESNIMLFQGECRHKLPVIGFYGDHARTRQRTIAGNRHRGGDITGLERKMPLVRDLLGIDWMVWKEAVLAVPPAYAEHIGRQLLNALENGFGAIQQ